MYLSVAGFTIEKIILQKVKGFAKNCGLVMFYCRPHFIVDFKTAEFLLFHLSNFVQTDGDVSLNPLRRSIFSLEH